MLNFQSMVNVTALITGSVTVIDGSEKQKCTKLEFERVYRKRESEG